MRHVAALAVSLLITFVVSGLLLAVGWRLDNLDAYAGAAAGLVLGFVAATVFLRPGRRRHDRPSPARYALAGAVAALVNLVAAGSAVLAQPYLLARDGSGLWSGLLMVATGGWMVAKAAAEPGRLIVLAVATVASGLIAGFAYGLMLRRPRPARPSRA